MARGVSFPLGSFEPNEKEDWEARAVPLPQRLCEGIKMKRWPLFIVAAGSLILVAVRMIWPSLMVADLDASSGTGGLLEAAMVSSGALAKKEAGIHFNLQSVDNCPFLLHVLDLGLLIETQATAGIG
jgi:hypothetical protein